jgi:hypothetical protein
MKNYKVFIVYVALCAFCMVSPSFAMEGGDSQESCLTVSAIGSFSDLKIEEGSILFLDIDSTLLHRSSRIKGNTSEELSKKHLAFCEAIQQVDLESHLKLQSAGKGLVELTENNIPDILEKLSQRNVILIPFTSRCASEESIAKTTEQLARLGYKFNAWNEGKLNLLVAEYGHASFRDGILYGNGLANPNKGLGVKAVTEELYGKVTAFGFVDDKGKNTEAVKEAMVSSSITGGIYKYKAPNRDFDVQKIEMIYRHSLGHKFEEHEELFKKHFN